MRSKKKMLPKVDLSKYSSVERLNSNIEVILVNGLITFGCDTKKTSKHFNIDEEVVNAVLIKYYAYIEKISSINARDDKTEATLDDIVHLFYQHCDEIKQQIDRNPATKVLSERLVSNLTKICDRCLDAKEANTRQYESTINKLNDSIIKFKQLETLENGKIENVEDYLANQQTVIERIGAYKENYSYNEGKHVKVLDTETGEYEVYPSIQSFVRKLGLSSQSHISYVMNSGNLYKGHFKITETDEEPTVYE